MRHCEKSRSFVCQSVIAIDIVVMHVWMSISWVMKYSLAKAGEPTGEPRRQKPVVSSAGRGGPIISTSFGLVEYLEMASEIEVVSVGLMWWRSGMGEWPEVEVRIWGFIGFTKHPSGAPMVVNRLHRNCRSLSGTQVEMSST
jgi:hypothetical protein